MSSPGDAWADFRPAENRVGIESESGVRLYFAQLRRCLSALTHLVREGTSVTNAERRATEGFVHQLRRTCDALALRHFFVRRGRELRIDATDSGFFHWSALLEAAAELDAKDARLGELPTQTALKRRMLERIVDYSLHPRELQEAMLERLFLESLDAKEIFRPFLPGPLTRVGEKTAPASYFWSFATYDRTQNRPFIYLIYFRWSGRPLSEASAELGELRRVAESTASGSVNLLAFSNRLDERLTDLHPRIVKRLVLGPYWSPFFTQNEGELGELLASCEDRLPYAFRFEAETLISERETRVGEGWFSKGQLRQVFWIPKQLDLSRRGVSQIERYLCLPPWLAQQVRSAGLWSDHRVVVVEDDGTLHGLA
jgi:hypothetical protein